MSLPDPPTPAGWPWPLDAVQDWFESLWDQLDAWFEGVASSVWEALPDGLKALATYMGELTVEAWGAVLSFFRDPLGTLQAGFDSLFIQVRLHVGWWDPVQSRFVGGFLGWLWDTLSFISDKISESAGWVAGELGPSLEGLAAGLKGVLTWIWDALQTTAGWISSRVWGWVDGSLKWLTDTFRWLRDEITEVGEWMVGEVTTAFDGAVSVLGEALTSLFAPALESFTGFAEYVREIRIEIDLDLFLADLARVLGGVTVGLGTVWRTASPRSPEEALEIGIAQREKADSEIHLWVQGAMWGEALSLGQMDASFGLLTTVPKFDAYRGMAVDLYKAQIDASLGIPFRQAVMRLYTPMVPPAPDLIQMVVREAFDPEVVVKAPEVFAEYMELSGFSDEWADRYWTAHFLPIELRQAYDNLWRGYWDEEAFKRWLLIADIHPMWWDDIFRVAYRPMTRRELRYGWETGVVVPEKMTAAFRAMGLSPEDAVIATDAAIEYALHEERMGVLTEWRYDFQDGLVNEATFRANMDSIRILGDRQDYYVARATIRRERQRMKDLLDLYRDGYMKDVLREEELRDRVHEIIVIPEVADLFVEKAYVDKMKKPIPPRETTEEAALEELHKYQITYAIQAYRRYAVEKEDLVSMLIDADVAVDVARVRADYEELKRPKPKPSAEAIADAKVAAKLQSVEVRTAIEEYRRYVLDDSELLRRLEEAGLTEELATAQMQLESIRRPAPPVPPEEIERRRLEESVRRYVGLMLVEQYRRYAIEKEELVAGLIVAGFDPAEGAARASYEEARRPVPKPTAEEVEARREELRRRKLAESEALTLFRAEAITSEGLRERLRALEYSEDLVEALVSFEEVKLALKKAG